MTWELCTRRKLDFYLKRNLFTIFYKCCSVMLQILNAEVHLQHCFLVRLQNCKISSSVAISSLTDGGWNDQVPMASILSFTVVREKLVQCCSELVFSEKSLVSNWDAEWFYDPFVRAHGGTIICRAKVIALMSWENLPNCTVWDRIRLFCSVHAMKYLAAWNCFL